jgi:hypothetical protein
MAKANTKNTTATSNSRPGNTGKYAAFAAAKGKALGPAHPPSGSAPKTTLDRDPSLQDALAKTSSVGMPCREKQADNKCARDGRDVNGSWLTIQQDCLQAEHCPHPQGRN